MLKRFGGGRNRSRGQSLVEFSVVLPVMLALTGVVIDASRLYQVWVNLESSTRDAAQYLATSNRDPSNADYTTAGSNADNKAQYILETGTGSSFAISPTSGTLTDCSSGQVTTTYTVDTTWTNGGSSAFPLSTAKVKSCLAFKTVFAYPFLTTNGAWQLRTEREMTVLVGR